MGDSDESEELVPSLGEDDGRESVKKIRALMGERFQVLLIDGRLLIGSLYCLDKKGNILLVDVIEHWRKKSLSSEIINENVGKTEINLQNYVEQRGLNVVMVAKQYRAAIKRHLLDDILEP